MWTAILRHQELFFLIFCKIFLINTKTKNKQDNGRVSSWEIVRYAEVFKWDE
jgi:hypothetical protein